MDNFESKTLKKTFDDIVFGSIAASGAAQRRGGGDMAAPHAGVAKPVDAGNIKVAKATGPDAGTVAEISAKKHRPQGQDRCGSRKVVKFMPAVLGKNWLHLRDGTGSATDGTNDLVVTTKDEAKVGDVVLVKGVVQTNRDLGSGYSFKLLVEEATLQKSSPDCPAPTHSMP